MTLRASPALALALALAMGLSLTVTPALAQGLPEADPARAALLIDTIRANDCGLTEEEAAETLPDLGFEMEESQGIVMVLIVTALADFEGERLVLAESLCQADPDEDPALFTAAAERVAELDATPRAEPPVEEVLSQIREGLGQPFVRGAIEALAEAEDCALDLSDPAALRAELIGFLSTYVSIILALSQPLDPAVTDELGAMVDDFLAAPGPDFAERDGRLVLDGCAP